MKKTINIKHSIENYATKTTQYQGKDHLIVPVVLLKEGVHHGSGGALLYTEQELSKYPAAWNFSPVPVYHPTNGADPVSCKNPDVIDSYNIGTLFNVIWDSNSKSLKGEIYVDVEKALNEFEDVYNALLDKQPMDVSTGLVFDLDSVTGEWNGEQYDGVVKNMIPDHLALLPGQEGACSWEDGCGIRVNVSGMEFDIASKEGLNRIKEMMANELSHDDIRKQLWNLAEKKHPDSWVYVQEVYDDYFIYEMEPKNNGDISYYKLEYTLEEGDAVVVGLPDKVERIVTWQTTNKRGDNSMKTLKDCCPDKIEKIINSEYTIFAEHDRGYVEGLAEDRGDEILTTINTLEAETAQAKQESEEKDKALQAANAKVAELTNQKADDDPQQITEEQLPEGLRAVYNFGKQQIEQIKTDSIQIILANERNSFTEDELKAKDVDELKKLAEMARPVNYTGNLGGEPPKGEDDKDDFTMPKVNWTGKDEE